MSYIYKIENLKDGKIYIGSTKDYKTRWTQHIKGLRSGNHPNYHLQNAWNKYCFKFKVLEEVPLKDQSKKEQDYLNLIKPFDENGYNIVRQIDAAFLYKNPLVKECRMCGNKYETFSHNALYCDERKEEMRREESRKYFSGDTHASRSWKAFWDNCGGAIEAAGGWDLWWDSFL